MATRDRNSKYRSKERVTVEVDGIRRLKYAVGDPIPEDEARRQGLLDGAAEGVEVDPATGLPSGDGAILGEGRAPGEPSKDGSTLLGKAKNATKASPAKKAAKAPEPYDPSAYTIAEVNTYLDANPDDVAAVLAAEAGGKARKGIVEGPHAADGS